MRLVREDILGISDMIKNKLMSYVGMIPCKDQGNVILCPDGSVKCVFYNDHVDIYKRGECKTVVFKTPPLPNVGDERWLSEDLIIDCIKNTIDNFDSIGRSTINESVSTFKIDSLTSPDTVYEKLINKGSMSVSSGNSGFSVKIGRNIVFSYEKSKKVYSVTGKNSSIAISDLAGTSLSYEDRTGILSVIHRGVVTRLS